MLLLFFSHHNLFRNASVLSREMDNFMEGEKHEMIELYMKSGITEEDATLVIETLSKYRDFFVDHMLVVELGNK